MTHTLSIVICTKEREASLFNCINSILNQSDLPEEIIVIDDGEIDSGKFDELIKNSGISFKYIKKDKPGLTLSRNLSLSYANMDIIMFLDDDVILDPEYICGIMKIFEEDNDCTVGGVTGTLRIKYKMGVIPFLRFFGLDAAKPGQILPNGMGVLVREGEIDAPIYVQWLSGCNMSYRKDVFDHFRFNEQYTTYGLGEDRDFSFRVSSRYKLKATPYAKLVHLKEESGRIDEYKYGYMEVNNLFKFYWEFQPHRFSNWLLLFWAFCGIVLKNTLLMIFKYQQKEYINRFKGNIVGIVKIIKQYS